MREGNRRTDKSFGDPSVLKLLPCLNNMETKKKLAYYFPLPRQSFIFPKFCHWPCQTEWKVFFPNCVDDFERFSGSVCRISRKFVRRFSPTAPFYLINTSNIFSICQIHLGMVQELCKNIRKYFSIRKLTFHILWVKTHIQFKTTVFHHSTTLVWYKMA